MAGQNKRHTSTYQHTRKAQSNAANCVCVMIMIPLTQPHSPVVNPKGCPCEGDASTNFGLSLVAHHVPVSVSSALKTTAAKLSHVVTLRLPGHAGGTCREEFHTSSKLRGGFVPTHKGNIGKKMAHVRS